MSDTKRQEKNADLGQYTNDVLSLIETNNFTAGRYAKNNGPELSLLYNSRKCVCLCVCVCNVKSANFP